MGGVGGPILSEATRMPAPAAAPGKIGRYRRLTPGPCGVMMYVGGLIRSGHRPGALDDRLSGVGLVRIRSGGVRATLNVFARRSSVGLPSRITTPEGGLLKLATTAQVMTLTSLDRACLCARVAAE